MNKNFLRNILNERGLNISDLCRIYGAYMGVHDPHAAITKYGKFCRRYTHDWRTIPLNRAQEILACLGLGIKVE